MGNQCYQVTNQPVSAQVSINTRTPVHIPQVSENIATCVQYDHMNNVFGLPQNAQIEQIKGSNSSVLSIKRKDGKLRVFHENNENENLNIKQVLISNIQTYKQNNEYLLQQKPINLCILSDPLRKASYEQIMKGPIYYSNPV